MYDIKHKCGNWDLVKHNILSSETKNDIHSDKCLMFHVPHRHHTNPVGTSWRWKMDDAQLIFDGALSNHVKLINEFKGNRELN